MELNLSSIAKELQDEEKAYEFVEAVRWPNGPICPHCGVIDHAYHMKPKNGLRKTRRGKPSYRSLWKCAECRKQFSVLVGTSFEGSKIPLSKWLLGFHLMCAGKNGISAHELHRELKISYEAAWFMAHRIRYAFTPAGPQPRLEGTVEADETYVGGKIKGAGKGWGLASKTPVVTLVERDGEARSQVVADVTSKNVRQILWSNVDPDANLMTDENNVYEGPGKVFASHETVNHSKEEFVRGDAHVNTAEGYFSQFRRSLDGTYHHVSRQHLHRYVSEFDFRYNNRKIKDGERTVKAIKKTAGKRLMYEQAIARETAK
jgi:transposase-like protein